MKVWRVQNLHGQGPYIGFNESWTTKEHIPPNNPDPSEDQFLSYFWRNLSHNVRKFYLCGFDSIESLNNWFSKQELTNLETMGFFVTVLDIPDELVVNGDKQIIFQKPGFVPNFNHIMEYDIITF